MQYSRPLFVYIKMLDFLHLILQKSNKKDLTLDIDLGFKFRQYLINSILELFENRAYLNLKEKYKNLLVKNKIIEDIIVDYLFLNQNSDHLASELKRDFERIFIGRFTDCFNYDESKHILIDLEINIYSFEIKLTFIEQ